jgi:hypothetical protein
VATPEGGGRPRAIIHHARTSGLAVQTGSLLAVTGDSPGTNVVQIDNEGGGAVQVEWNSGAVHPFTGITNIVVDTRNARKDQVTLDDAPEVKPL